MGNPQVQKMLQTSDCVLAVGTELSETDFWDTQVVIAKNLIRVDIDPAAIARPHTAEIPILGDAPETLEALAPLVTARAAQPKPKLAKGEDDALRTMLSKVLATIREALPEDTVIASDMTQIAYAANIIFPMYVPRTWLHPVGFGTLGFGLPAGIGAKFGVGKKPVAVMIGDYGIQFTINELGTAAEHKLPVVILMWNNNALGQIRDDMIMKGIQPNAVNARNPDFQLLFRAYGCHADKPASVDDIGPAIAKALTGDRPSLIEMTPQMAGL
jgi:thiamine pyrophosphate-dependent acetolactate synthase large subunit-like protein